MVRPRHILVLATLIGSVLTLVTGQAAATGFQSVASAAASPDVVTSWSQHIANGVSQSSPIAVSRNGVLQVVVGDSGGRLNSLNMSNGSFTWTRILPISSILSALSTDNHSIFAGLTSRNGTANTVAAFDVVGGGTFWGANPCTRCAQLGGATLTGSAAAVGSGQHYVFGLAATNGQRRWSYMNSDTTNSTPAVADLYGNGAQEWIYTTDQTGNSRVNPPALSGGHLRIFTSGGTEICNANIGGGPQSPGSFDSSPAVASFGGSTPMIVFGTGQSGTYSGRLLVYNTACQQVWVSPQLAGQTIGAPAIADVTGSGTVVAIEEVADSAGHPVVYEVDIRNQRILNARTLSQCNGFRPGTSSSVVTANLGNRGYQDLIVPAGQCGAVVLDGRSLQQIGLVGPSCGLQNSPLVTNDGGGRVGITVAGYAARPGGGMWGCIAHAEVANSSLGSNGWPEFHHDAQLTGTLSNSLSRRDGLVAGETLGSGQSLYSATGGYKLTMQTNGYLVLTNSSGRVLWSTHGRPVPGARLVITNTVLRLYSGNTDVDQIWAVSANSRPTHLIVTTNGAVSLFMAGPTEWSNDTLLYRG